MVTFGSLLQQLGPYGPTGVVLAYFFWREQVRDKRDEKRDARLEQILKDRAEADKEMAVSLNILADRLR